MTTNLRNNENELEFEEFPGRAEIQISKVLITPEGDKIRAIVTTGNSVMLTALGDSSGDTVIVTGELPTDQVVYFSVWGTIKKIGSFIGGLLGGGGGQKCTTTTTVTLDANGKVKSITTTTVCSPA